MATFSTGFQQPADCTCAWGGTFEGEVLGVVYEITEPDKRCPSHGKPRWAAERKRNR